MKSYIRASKHTILITMSYNVNRPEIRTLQLSINCTTDKNSLTHVDISNHSKIVSLENNFLTFRVA